jgi:hypothetical protein
MASQPSQPTRRTSFCKDGTGDAAPPPSAAKRAEQLVALLAPLAAAGVIPLASGSARYLVDAAVVDAGAVCVLRTLLSLADVFAA